MWCLVKVLKAPIELQPLAFFLFLINVCEMRRILCILTK